MTVSSNDVDASEAMQTQRAVASSDFTNVLLNLQFFFFWPFFWSITYSDRNKKTCLKKQMCKMHKVEQTLKWSLQMAVP